MADKWVQRWKVESHSTPGKTYTVAIDKDGEWGCSCPVWKFRRKECKHIQEVKAQQNLPMNWGKVAEKPEPAPKPAAVSAPATCSTRAALLEI